MKILRMTATFGCLDGAVLELGAGCNVRILPNESGKSTWAAFLTAMFYGIDTTQRAAKGRLPEKTRWQPWNGKPMTGLVELEYNGRQIVLQRTSRKGRPIGEFRAYDRETGLELPELTGENCGLYFFGVERSVFQRSAFLSGEELAVTNDETLAQRLENLATAGEMQDNYGQAAAALKLWRNRCRYHQNGLIPEKEAKLRQVEGTLSLLEELRQQRQAAVAARDQYRQEADAMERQEKAQWQQRKTAAVSAVTQALARVETMESRVLLSEEDCLQIQALLQREPAAELQPEPECPPALRGIGAEAIMAKAQRDLAEYTRRTQEKRRRTALIPAVLGVILALAAGILQLWWAIPIGVLLGGVGVWLQCRSDLRFRKSKADAAALLESYGAADEDGLLAAAVTRRDWLLAQQKSRRQSWEAELLLEQLRHWFPQLQKPAEAQAALVQAQVDRQALEEARRALERAEREKELASQPWRPGEALLALKEKAAALHLQAETLRSKEEALGGWETLAYRRETLQRELAALLQREEALAMAQAALEEAHDRLAQVYAPRLTGLAGEYLQKLTQNRYDALILGREFNLQVRETASGLTRPLVCLSSGAKDQVWLALRLAMTRLLLPEGTPLWLDDALLTFDAERTAAALEVLAQENRQVILLQCRQA